MPGKPRSRLSARHVAVCRQGIYVKYPVDYSKCCALNGILMSTVELKSKAFLAVDSGALCPGKQRKVLRRASDAR
eukprot:5983497-Pyramimonas_sp.AAC.1